MRRGISIIGAVVGLLAASVGTASAAPPQVGSTAVVPGSVTSTGVELAGSVDPNGTSTTYRFEYLTAAAYEANLEAQPPREAFAGASFAPSSGSGPAGFGAVAVSVSQHVGGLTPSTAYRYRLRATNVGGETASSVAHPFATQAATNVFELLDHRGWEMVSPIAKAGGAIQPPGQVSGGGVFQAAAGGGAFTYSSADSFGEGAQGAPSGSQYLASRTTGGWSTANITTPLLSGSYGSEPDGVPYQLFSGDLGSGLLSGGERCRGVAGGGCPVANPPLPGSGAPAGYRDYYRRDASGGFESLLTSADVQYTRLGPEQFELRLVAATPDLSHVVLSTCAALTADAIEVAAPGGCDEERQNLYEWSGGALSLINILPGQTTGTPGARIAGRIGAVATTVGESVYWTDGRDLYLRQGGETKPVDEAQGGGGEFQTASASGSVAYFTDAGDLYRFDAGSGGVTRLTVSGEVAGVLGASDDGSRAYFGTSNGVFLAEGASTAKIAAGAAASSDYLTGEGTARVSADGSHLLFLSDAELTGYPNEGDTEVFLYGPPPGGSTALLTCVSCNPSGEAPQGSASIPGTRPNGIGASALDIFRPRVLSAAGNRVFFETTDSLSPQDTNKGAVDVYEWEAAGEGTCINGGGCVQLISGGREPMTSSFLDADESGGEAFFLTEESLYPLDPGSYDVYVARENGGFAVPESPIPCVADACQILPEAPEDPVPGTLTPNSGNPALKVSGGTSERGKKNKGKGKKNKKKKHHKKKAKKPGKRSKK